jgi:DNA helicase-2/ATP-dependent DNA helicase PcrA
MFVWTTDELDAQQSDAVLEAGSVFLVACPGSGKTRALTYKIAYELSLLESARRFVIAITYTNRAADEIKERIEDLGVDTSQLWIGTIHAFCLEWILRPYAIYEPELAHGFGILDLHEREKLLEELCSAQAPGLTFWDCDYFVTPTGYMLGCPDQRKHQNIERVLAAYFEALAQRRQLDFELILAHAFKLIRETPAIKSILAKLLSVVLVDEYQDTKEIQYEVIADIIRAGAGETKLFMVGDPNQSIYGSLGGHAISLDQLRQMTGIHIVKKELSANYRSSERIVSYFEKFNVYGTTISAEGEHRLFPSTISYDAQTSSGTLVDEVARLIRHSVETVHIHPSEICVLAPQWVHLASMTRRLVAALPEYQFDGPGMVPFARDMENFWYKLSRIALTEPAPGAYVKRYRWASEVLNELRSAGIDTKEWGPKELLRESNAIVIHTDDGLTFLRTYFERIFAAMDIRAVDHPQLLEQHGAFFGASQARIARLEGDGVVGVGELAFFRKTFQNRTGIAVSTIHGVKGAEFDVVIAYGLLEGMVPHFNDQRGDKSAKKLLYVLSSRARKNLHLFSETGRPRGRRGDTYSATHVLATCQFEYDQA